MSTTTSPTRRVLGPKNPNAPLQQHTSKGSNTALQVASPASQRPAKRPLSRASSPAMSPRIGQKRKIEEVHETERADSQETNNNASDSSSQMTDLLSDSQSEMGDKSRTSMSQSKSTLNTTFTSFHGSQEEPPPVEPEFHILEEASQQTLDKMVCRCSTARACFLLTLPQHAVTFTQNTSQLVPDLRPSLAPEASQVSLMSMSSLIDFDTHRSSQDDDMQMLEETESVTKDEPRKTDEDVRREMMLEVSLSHISIVNPFCLFVLTKPAESRNSPYATAARLLQDPDQPNHAAFRAVAAPQAPIFLSRSARPILIHYSGGRLFHFVSRSLCLYGSRTGDFRSQPRGARALQHTRAANPSHGLLSAVEPRTRHHQPSYPGASEQQSNVKFANQDHNHSQQPAALSDRRTRCRGQQSSSFHSRGRNDAPRTENAHSTLEPDRQR